MTLPKSILDLLPVELRELPDVGVPRKCPCGAILIAKRPPTGGLLVWHGPAEPCAAHLAHFGGRK